MANDRVLEHWSYRATSGGATTVIPDGCRDLIIHHPKNNCPVTFVSQLAQTPFHAPHRVGDLYQGFRLFPHIRLDETALVASLRGVKSDGDIFDRIDNFSAPILRVKDALEGLAQRGETILQIASSLGVQLRSLQRMLLKETGHSPIWWARLARARQALAHGAQGTSLAELAYECGFSDQAHMTREFRLWFGATPRAVFSDPIWIQTSLVRGYAV